MNEFYEDVRERASTARSARHKINGCKSSYVSLPSDTLTAAQKRKMSGEVMTYNMNAPVSIGAFRSWPRDLQKEYIRKRVDQFPDLTASAAGKIFGMQATSCCAAMKCLGLQGLFHSGRCSKATAQAVEAWVADPKASAAVSELAKDPDEEPGFNDIQPTEGSTEDALQQAMFAGTISLKGDAHTIVKAIATLLGDKPCLLVNLRFDTCKEEEKHG